MKHEHVCLLEHLRAARSLPAEEEVGGDGPVRGDLRDHERLQLVEARELLVDACQGVVSVDERVGDREPLRALVFVDTVERGGAAKVPARNHVGERVVVHGLVVLVRADDPVDVRAAVAGVANA